MSHPLAFLLRGWRDFVVDVHILVGGRLDPNFARQIYDLEPPSYFHPSRVTRTVLAKLALHAAEKARESLDAGDPERAQTAWEVSLHLFDVANRPSDRWYLNSPVILLDIVIDSLMRRSLFVQARLYVRVALFIRPKSPALYAVLPRLAAGLGATNLLRECEALAREAQSTSDWRKLSRRAVALLSLTGIALVEMKQMTDVEMQSLLRIRLEDLHTPLNLPTAALPLLPWLTEEECNLMA
jgi:hypothetical protein